MVKRAVLFDLGGTLVQYFEKSEFPGILMQAITEVQGYLRREGLLNISSESMWRKVQEEDYEAKDYSVRPLEERLARIFQLDAAVRTNELLMTICRLFMKPIFARGQCYEDSLSVLRELRLRRFKTGIVSNTTWGSPAILWREEIKRLGLDKLVDTAVFCRDTGWRKPARQVFQLTLRNLHLNPQDCVFVGDDPRWDLIGPRAVGIKAVLIDRQGVFQDAEEEPIKNLYELLDRPQLLQ